MSSRRVERLDFHLGTHGYDRAPLATSVDLTTQGAVTQVKNQRQRDFCQTFSTTDPLEGVWSLSTGSLVSLSEQQFEDCDFTCSGCHGGLKNYAFACAVQNTVCTVGVSRGWLFGHTEVLRL